MVKFVVTVASKEIGNALAYANSLILMPTMAGTATEKGITTVVRSICFVRQTVRTTSLYTRGCFEPVSTIPFLGSVLTANFDLNLRRSGHVLYHEMKIDSDGVPVCPIGCKMIHWGRCSLRHRTKWRCPAAVGGWTCAHPCFPSAYGRTFYTATS